MTKEYLITFNPDLEPEVRKQLKSKKIRFLFFRNIQGVASLDLTPSQVDLVRQSPLVNTLEENAPVYPLASTFADEDHQNIPGDLGESTLVYVLDTGVNCIKTLHKEYFVEDTNTKYNSHGTHVASSIKIVLPKVTIISVQVLGGKLGMGSTKGIIKGVDFVYGDIAKRTNYKYVYMNMSLGSSDQSSAMCLSANKCLDNKVMTFVAAGNDDKNKPIPSIGSPANCTNVITVGALDPYDNKSEFSDYDPIDTKPNVSVLGENITAYDHTTCNIDRVMDGTSMACPLALAVAGAVVSDPIFSVPSFRTMTTAEFKHLQQIIVESGKDYFDNRGHILTYHQVLEAVKNLYQSLPKDVPQKTTIHKKSYSVWTDLPRISEGRFNPNRDPYMRS
jgi:subtilisin family serine protease